MKRLILLLLPWTLFAATDLVKQVRIGLYNLPGVFDNLTFRVDGNKVTLAGQVLDPKLKSRAEKAIKKIEGVSSVDNQIEVMPLSSMDDRIREAVYRAIYTMPTLARYAPIAYNDPLPGPGIHIIVKNGDVTLEGLVANSMEKTMAGVAASDVRGVFTLTNSLRTD